jgi:selenocysteine lyase/cysteine desulfurase
MDRLAQVRELFDPAPGSIYLDTATYGLPPRPTVDVMHRAVADWQSGTADWVTAWDRAGEAARTAFANLINVPEASVALEPAVSVGTGLVAATLGPGDEVVVPADEFPSVISPLMVAAERNGAHVRPVPFDQLAASVKPSTTLVAFSLVQAQSGRSADLENIVANAKAHSARTLVDATHALPFVRVADEIDDIDYLVCSAYKHLLCPRGVAFMYVKEEHWDALPPLLANWRSVAEPYAHHFGPGLNLAPDAARFDVSLAWFSWAGAAVSLKLLADWQQQGLLAEVPPLAQRLATQLNLPAPHGTVVSVPVENADAVRDELADAGIKAAVRVGSVRLAPHVYTTEEQIDRAAEALQAYVRPPAGQAQ